MDIVYLIGSIAGGLILAYIGALIGSMKGHTTLGFFLGLLLGPIGLIIIAMHQDDRFKCPACGGSIVPGKPRCKNCGVEISQCVAAATHPCPRAAKAFVPIPRSDPMMPVARIRPTPIRTIECKRAEGAS